MICILFYSMIILINDNNYGVKSNTCSDVIKEID